MTYQTISSTTQAAFVEFKERDKQKAITSFDILVYNALRKLPLDRGFSPSGKKDPALKVFLDEKARLIKILQVNRGNAFPILKALTEEELKNLLVELEQT